VVELAHVSTRFGEHQVHRDINLCLQPGEILGLVGGSGAGKTTLLRLILGLEYPWQGTVRLLGHDLATTDPDLQKQLRGSCGVLFQGGALFTALNVFENVALPLRELRVLDEDLIARLVYMGLGMVGLERWVGGLMPAELSGGMVKRVGLARALALGPELLLLDEPTSGLDPISGDAFVTLVRALHQELGFSAMLITHDLDTLVELCDRIAVLADQRLVALGSIQDVLHASHPYVQAFFGGPRARHLLEPMPEARS
jgi:phospholipid/cholesterol/gamma-HCH transport system ATP-binding protein